MYCKNCGGQLDNEAKFCSNCGYKSGKGNVYCGNCGVKSTRIVSCQNCGSVIEELNQETNENQYSSYNNYSNNNVSYDTQKQKSRVAAGILGILIGGLGIHRFYLGYVGIGILQIVVTILTCGAGSLWGFIEGILILCGSTITTDADGKPLSDN